MLTIICKQCSSNKVVKNGQVRSEQRYKYKKCHHSFGLKGQKGCRNRPETVINSIFAANLEFMAKKNARTRT